MSTNLTAVLQQLLQTKGEHLAYASGESIPEPWLSFLRELDSAVHEEVRLNCMGGFGVTMVYGFSRPTGDLDVPEIAPRDAGRTTALFSRGSRRVVRSVVATRQFGSCDDG